MPDTGTSPVKARRRGVAVVRLIGIIGWAAAILIAVAIPALYCTFAVKAERDALEIESDYTAKAIQSIVFARQEMWEFETLRLLEIVSKRTVDGEADDRTLYDASGKIIIETKYKAPAPAISRSVPIVVSGEKAGVLLAKRSVRKSAWGTVFAGIIGSAFGIGVFLFFRSFPLRLLKEALAGLASEKKKTETTLSYIGDGVITIDGEGGIVYMNPVAETCTGWKFHEAAGRYIKECYVTRKEIERIVGEVYTHCALVSRNGDQRIIEEVWTAIKGEHSADDGHVIVFRDVTERRRMEAEVFRGRQLESIGVLAGGIAHDFNNFLTGILGNVSLAKYQIEGNPKALERLEESEKAIMKARELAQKLLIFSKGGKPVRKVVDLEEIVSDAAQLAVRGTAVKSTVDAGKTLMKTFVDPSQISQVISNIVINAVQAINGPGNIRIAMENTRVYEEQVQHVRPGRYVLVKIADDGPGIPKSMISRIFEPYFTTKSTGNGLGLATCYNIMKAHGGNIFVESTPGEGATFILYIPATASEEATEAQLGTVKPESPNAAHGRILVMDDEPYIRDLLQEMLGLLGYSVTACRDGAEAIDRYVKAVEKGERFDAVIMDLTIPGGMGGKEAGTRILSLHPDARLVVSSGYSNDPILANPEEFGFRGVISKPYRVEDIAKVLREVILR